ncbi:MAG TPA: ABC transporter permease [Trinickia sp.]|jgi:putative ABC transport system permease protein|uniref:ABC transporter permease n=1 Tax=Trinickia sp. TaxID=2571163 RepID=UPI002C203F01|nr:ABC transporter permease [Trinickia sp.]HTI17637.1 ABC transporter permease [Trinickia sp.]
MKYVPLMWAMLWRKKLRTSLTLMSIVIAFLLFGMLQGINAAFQEVIERSNVNRLIVTNKISLTESLPYSYLSQLESIPGVAIVSHESWFGPYYQDPKNLIAAFPVEPDLEFPAHPEVVVSKAQIDALKKTRTGVIVGAGLAEKYQWKIGDRIPLHSTIWVKASDGSSDWDVDIVGIYEQPSNRTREDAMFFNYAYFDEARSFGKGTVGWYVVQLNDPSQSAQIAATIDRRFANSPNETKTQTEKEFQQAFLKQIADINLIVTYILIAVFFALLFAVGSTAMQAVREQVPELAVMKTLGFSDTRVLVLVLVQALAVCVVAASLGLAIAQFLFPLLRDTLGVVTMPLAVVVEGVAIAAILAAATGIIPAWRAKRLVIAEALRS